MGITFQGNVSIYGNVEIYDNQSMKITSRNDVSIPINKLQDFINTSLKHSPNKDDYLEAVTELKESKEPNKLKNAIAKLKELTAEVGKNILITGLSRETLDIIKELFQ